MNMKAKIVLLLFCLISAGVFGFYKLAEMFAPGSYPYAEIYELNFSEKNTLNAIKQFQVQYPEIVVPKVTIKNKGSFNLGESEGQKGDAHWYSIYFYYPKENRIVYACTRPNGKEKTSFAFVLLNEGLDIGHWKDINKDFDSIENDKLKHEFEVRILKPIMKIAKNMK